MRLSAIRGATTALNTKEDIIEKTTQLFHEIITQNRLSMRKIICVMAGSTMDITAYYPATALRLNGCTAPLFSSVEPQIEGSLPKCIRLMVMAKTKRAQHVYLNGAANLLSQPNNGGFMRIAIDGPSGAGKSTVAKLLSSRLNILYLDTGAMYRAVALKAHNTGTPIKDAEVSLMLKTTKVDIKYKDGAQLVYLDGADVSKEIRQHFMSKLASDISALKEVRLFLVEMQRQIASSSDCVLDGRDIGSFVLPDAEYKFYITASVDERTNRRHKELADKGEINEWSKIKEDIQRRDYNDMNRDFAPLKKADGATEIDSTLMTAEEVASLIIAAIKKGEGV